MQQYQCPVEIIALGHQLAGLCRPILQQTFRQGLNVKMKVNAVPVTQTDLAVETIVRDYLAKARPEDGVVGEEFEPHNPGAEYVWVVDPIIGTDNFIAGNHSFCFLLGCMNKGRPVFGLMDQPVTGDRWIGAAGYAATLNDKRISVNASHVSETPLRIAVTGTAMKNTKIKDVALKMEKDGHFIMRGGDTALIGMLAAGWIDCLINDCGDEYSYMPLLPVLYGAGGVLSDIEGNPGEAGITGITIAGSEKIIKEAILKYFE